MDTSITTSTPTTRHNYHAVQQTSIRWKEAGAVALLLGVGGGVFWGLSATSAPSQEVEMAGYATSLKGRTVSQQHNAGKAADALNGKIIAPGAVFSFNATVKSWSADQGFVKAPVSYDGELIRAYGGGVCQTSTTLYNAALLAGLPIVERHAHVFAPHYIPPGQDAAVAQRNIDLRFRNPYKWPLRIAAKTEGDHLDIRLYGAEVVPQRIQVTTHILSTSAPAHLTRVAYAGAFSSGRAYVRNPGAVGYRVVAYRTFSEADKPLKFDAREERRERLSDNTYQAMDRIIQVDEQVGE